MKQRSIRIDAAGNLNMHDIKKKNVTFSGKVRCRKHKVSKIDFEARWYTIEELKSFRSRDITYMQTLITSRDTSLAGNDDLEDVSLVGLLSETDYLERLRRVREARECVLEEQLVQEEKYFSEHAGIEGFQLDEEAIAEFYSCRTMTSSECARIRGYEVFCHIERMWAEEKMAEEKEDIENDASQRSRSQRSCSQRSRSQHSTSVSAKRDSSPLRVRSRPNNFRSLVGRLGRAW